MLELAIHREILSLRIIDLLSQLQNPARNSFSSVGFSLLLECVELFCLPLTIEIS